MSSLRHIRATQYGTSVRYIRYIWMRHTYPSHVSNDIAEDFVWVSPKGIDGGGRYNLFLQFLNALGPLLHPVP